MAKKILILPVIILASLFILEIGSGLIWRYDMSFRKIMKSSDNPRILYELKPNTKINFSGAFFKIPPSAIEISSQGLRDYEYPVRKEEGKFRIIILGDSIAFGWGVELDQG